MQPLRMGEFSVLCVTLMCMKGNAWMIWTTRVGFACLASILRLFDFPDLVSYLQDQLWKTMIQAHEGRTGL